MDSFVCFLQNHFINLVWLITILIAMCPMLESKIAIPLAINTSIWGSNALSPINAFLFSLLGNILPCYFILLIVKKLKNKTTGFFSSNFVNRYLKKSQKINIKNSLLKKYLSLSCFVAIPLPLTGVWSGSIIGGLTNLNVNYCFLSILIGSIISSLSIIILTIFFSNTILYIFMISILIIIFFLFLDLLISCIKKVRK